MIWIGLNLSNWWKGSAASSTRSAASSTASLTASRTACSCCSCSHAVVVVVVRGGCRQPTWTAAATSAPPVSLPHSPSITIEFNLNSFNSNRMQSNATFNWIELNLIGLSGFSELQINLILLISFHLNQVQILIKCNWINWIIRFVSWKLS